MMIKKYGWNTVAALQLFPISEGKNAQLMWRKEIPTSKLAKRSRRYHQSSCWEKEERLTNRHVPDYTDYSWETGKENNDADREDEEYR